MVRQRIADQVAFEAMSMDAVITAALSGKKEVLDKYLKDIRPHG